MSSSAIKVLLDSTYILPSFGVEVEGLSAEHATQLREAAVKGKVNFCCLSVVWVEVIGKICREKERLRKDIDDIVDIAVKSLMKSGFYEWLKPTSDAVKLAFKLRTLGHRDNIDNLLYATSTTNGMQLLTMDEDLKSFLSQNNLKVDNLINHENLLKMLG
jgi:PIN domain nuclease of toxin-antitoxin system